MGLTQQTQIQQSAQQGDTYELRWAEGDVNVTCDVEATDLGIEVNGKVIEWGWIFRQLARLEDNRQKSEIYA